MYISTKISCFPIGRNWILADTINITKGQNGGYPNCMGLGTFRFETREWRIPSVNLRANLLEETEKESSTTAKEVALQEQDCSFQ